MRDIFIFNNSDIRNFLPKRKVNTNKGDFGKVLIIAGSSTMCGCCVLAAKGALRSGVGIVKIAFPEELTVPLMSQLTECIFVPLKSENGHISKTETEKILNEASLCDVVVFGCGCTADDDISVFCEKLVTENKTPLIIDADGLNCLSHNPDSLLNRTCDILLTPHPGEMARLVGATATEVEAKRQECAENFADKYKVTVLLKGHETLVASYNQRKVYKNNTGNSGLSKGGSGDLLSGIIAGLFASSKRDLFISACAGAYIHGKTADILKQRYSEIAMLPSDCADALPQVYSQILFS